MSWISLNELTMSLALTGVVSDLTLPECNACHDAASFLHRLLVYLLPLHSPLFHLQFPHLLLRLYLYH